MWKITPAVLLLASACLAQTDTNSLTITASRSVPLQPDQVVFAVSVTSDMNSGLDDVLAALAGSGITASQLVSVSGTSFVVQTGADLKLVQGFQWAFTLPVPASKVKDVAGSLIAVQQKLAKANSDMTLSFSSSGLQASSQAESSQGCPYADLLADARAQAQRVVSGSPELSVGPILALAQGVTPLPAQILVPQVAVARFFGAFSASSVSGSSSSLTCTLVVKFSLLRYQ